MYLRSVIAMDVLTVCFSVALDDGRWEEAGDNKDRGKESLIVAPIVADKIDL